MINIFPDFESVVNADLTAGETVCDIVSYSVVVHDERTVLFD